MAVSIEKRRADRRRYYAELSDAQREQKRQREKARRKAKPEAVKKGDARYRVKHREKLRARANAFYKAHPDRVWTWTLATRFGITPADYVRMLAEQKGLCAICRCPPPAKKRFHVDHCHRTKRVRGLLCAHCNPGLGWFVDDPARLRAAADYLERNAR